jgi:carboxymethylenebutenolidase
MSEDDRPESAGTAYLVRPEAGTGPGVLVLHAWWGLTPFFKGLCDQLADDGFVALAPDLLGGRRPETAAEAELELGEMDPNETAALILSSTVALRSQTDDPDGPIAVLGFSMGASWALWLGTRQPDSVRSIVVYYGSQDMDFDTLRAPVLGHFAESDDFVSDDELVFLEAQLRLLDKDVEIVRYPGTGHWFAESDRESYDAPAAEAAWERTLEFLRPG